MYITVEVLVSNLSISTSWFFKVLRECNYSKTTMFHLDDLISLKKCIEKKHKQHYKKKLLIKQIDIQIDFLKART